MEKKRKIVRLTESELTGLIHNTLKTVMNEVIDGSNYGRNILNEMARLNKKDDSLSPFPYNKYQLWVQGDNSPHKPPHMHINYPQEGWEIKVFIESGDLWQVVSYGKREKMDSFSDIIKMVKEWFKLETKMPGRIGTNQEAALHEWDACN